MARPEATNTIEAGYIIGTDGVARPAWAYRTDRDFDYYEEEWGRTIITEHGLLERLCLEGFQSGLSWSTILAKRPAFRDVFFLFDATRIQAMTPTQREAALADERLIRNPRKHQAVYANADATVALRDDPGVQQLTTDAPARRVLGGVADMLPSGLPVLLWSFVPESHVRPARVEDIPSFTPEAVAMARELKRRGFQFVGPTTCYALMQAVGMVNDRVDASQRGALPGH